jgi:uncharacterized protein (UPF0333 family)
MKINTTIRAFALSATLATLAAVNFSSPAMAYQCKNSFKQGEGIAKLLIKSRSAAKKAWSAEAKNAYGLEWSVWNIASNDSVNCDWTGNNFYCIAKAKPCQYVVQ